MINPAEMMKIAGIMKKFQSNHPKVVAFMQHTFSNSIPVGSVIELTITKPGQDPVTTNFKVLEDDVEMVETLKKMHK
ncbi:hypothetical protein [Oribacterium sp. NK2B42]|uniref:hypothetical protein n=1 Tax=Oribacterium sp. NK2B42 TaxID=689781 RepID=UPI00041D18E9|nr:hypothetical protein [Oribacterium sp. NK2B42]